MNTKQKGFMHIIVVVLVVVLVGAVGYFVLTQNSGQTEKTTTLESSTQSPTSQAPTPTSVKEKTTGTPLIVDFPRIITCNPREFDSEYFKLEKPCSSDMTAVDIEKEKKALAIIAKEIKIDKSFKNFAIYPAQLFVSDKRYQLMSLNMGVRFGYVVVDTIAEKVTDYFSILGQSQFVERSSERLVFLDRIISQQTTTGEFVRQYIFGEEKSVDIQNTEVYSPQTYLWYEGPAGSASVKILDSSTSSITLGIYNRDKTLPRKPEDDSIKFEQVGTKVINLSN